MWWLDFAFTYENRTMKPVEIVLRSQGRENDGGVNLR
jgi:hypothetical protein